MTSTTKVRILYKKDIRNGFIFLGVILAIPFVFPLFLSGSLRYQEYFAFLFVFNPPFFIFTVFFIIILAITAYGIYMPIKDFRKFNFDLDREISREEVTLKEKRSRYKNHRILALIYMTLVSIISIVTFIFASGFGW